MIEIQYVDRDVLDALQQLQRRMVDMPPAMQDIAGVMADATERAFDDEADPATGLAWHPLMDSTVKMRGGDAHPILQRSGQLAASIVTEHGKDYAVVGSNKRYAAIHQFGGQAGRKRMATIQARPYLGLGEDDKDEILDIVRGYIAEALD